MQVSTIAELDTHAVIGGGQAQAFGMSDSAEFFTVLSDTLYRDKKRAVAREVICNAWDAHIMAGKTDVPVEITLNEKELIIKDFGPGIPKDKIGPVYCIYGASTKVKDANQTGGFGLGCKAPFAYSDHFTVTSCVDGFRTLWAISRGGAATDGKPDFRPMISVPTQETGISVSIPIKDPKDVATFDTLIREICRNGGMLAKLNGEKLPRYDYSEARKNGFCVLQRAGVNSFRESRAYVLYGTVLYPILTTDNELMVKVDALDNLIENNGRIVLIAGPNTIGVQPSREGLSYSELTTNSLHKMLDEATRRLKAVGPALARKLYRAHIKSVLKDRENIVLTSPTKHNDRFEGVLDNPNAIAERAVREKLGNYLPHGDMTRIAYREMQKKWRDDRRFFGRARHNWRDSLNRERFDRSRKLLLRLASKTGTLNKLIVFTKEYSHTRWGGTPIDEFRMNRPLEKRLIVAPTRKAVDELLRKEVAAASNGSWNQQEAAGERMVPALVLTNPSERLLEAIIEYGDKYKVQIDLLDFPKRKKREKVGDVYAGLRDLCLNTRGYNWRISKFSVAEPKQYIVASGTQERLDLGHIRYEDDKQALKDLDEMFPGTVVCWTAKQVAKMKAKKIPLLEDLIVEKITKLASSREAQYITALQEGYLITGPNTYYSPASLIQRLSAASLTIAKYFFPDRVRITGQMKELKKLMELGKFISGRSNKLNSVRTKLCEDAKRTCAHLARSAKDLDREFDFLKPFQSITYRPEDEAMILDTIRYLRRRAAKAPSPANTNINEELKEAA